MEMAAWMCQKLVGFEFDKNLNWCVNTFALSNILHFNENLKTTEIKSTQR